MICKQSWNWVKHLFDGTVLILYQYTMNQQHNFLSAHWNFWKQGLLWSRKREIKKPSQREDYAHYKQANALQ